MKRTSAVRTTRETHTREKRVYAAGGSAAPLQPALTWYERPESDLYEHACARVRGIKEQQVTRRYELFTYQQAYTSRFGPAAMASLFSPGTRNPSAGLYAISANIIKSCIDTACARISKSKPRAFVLPNKGDYRLKKKARQLTKFLDGAFQSAGVYQNAERVFRDACIYDGGALVLYAEDGQVCSQQVKVDELWIDQVDGIYETPREMHWSHAEPRTKLLAKYPEHAKAINEARGAWRGEMAYMGAADMVEVTRSWRLGECEDEYKGGVYAVSIATATLERQEYRKAYIPIFRFFWTEPVYGPFGDGIAKELYGMQRTVSDILRGICKSIRLFAVPRIWINKGATPGVVQITNELSVNTYTGEKPVFDTPPAAAPDIYQFLQWVIDWAYKQLGLSQLTAQSEKPAGLNSGVAMRTYQDVETQRFALIGQRWERWHMEVARAMIDIAQDLYAKDKSLSMKVAGRGFIETIDWKDVSLKEDQYDLQVWPTNLLPETPEGKLQAIQEYVQSGFMPLEVAIGQLNLPVLNDWVDRMTSALDIVESHIAGILDEGKFMPPDADMELPLALTVAGAEYNRARADKSVEPHKVELLLRYKTQVVMLLKLAQQANQAPAANSNAGLAGPGAPVGQAAAPPTSPLAPAGSGPVQMPQAAA